MFSEWLDIWGIYLEWLAINRLAALTRAGRIASLNDEVFDDAMKNRAVVVALET